MTITPDPSTSTIDAPASAIPVVSAIGWVSNSTDAVPDDVSSDSLERRLVARKNDKKTASATTCTVEKVVPKKTITFEVAAKNAKTVHTTVTTPGRSTVTQTKNLVSTKFRGGLFYRTSTTTVLSTVTIDITSTVVQTVIPTVTASVPIVPYYAICGPSNILNYTFGYAPSDSQDSNDTGSAADQEYNSGEDDGDDSSSNLLARFIFRRNESPSTKSQSARLRKNPTIKPHSSGQKPGLKIRSLGRRDDTNGTDDAIPVGIAQVNVSSNYTVDTSSDAATPYDCCAACAADPTCVGSFLSSSNECSLVIAADDSCPAPNSPIGTFYYDSEASIDAGQGITISNAGCGSWDEGLDVADVTSDSDDDDSSSDSDSSSSSSDDSDSDSDSDSGSDTDGCGGSSSDSDSDSSDDENTSTQCSNTATTQVPSTTDIPGSSAIPDDSAATATGIPGSFTIPDDSPATATDSSTFATTVPDQAPTDSSSGIDAGTVSTSTIDSPSSTATDVPTSSTQAASDNNADTSFDGSANVNFNSGSNSGISSNNNGDDTANSGRQGGRGRGRGGGRGGGGDN